MVMSPAAPDFFVVIFRVGADGNVGARARRPIEKATVSEIEIQAVPRWCSLSLGGWWPRIRRGAVENKAMTLTVRVMASRGAPGISTIPPAKRVEAISVTNGPTFLAPFARSAAPPQPSSRRH
jgi:hypothetical protein